MYKLTQSLRTWLSNNHPDKVALIMLGHVELLTEEMYKQYLEWCCTDEGRSYLKGGKNYKGDERPEEKNTETIVWNMGRPQEEGRYLVQDVEGGVDISYYYENGDIFRHEMEGGANVIKYATVPSGKELKENIINAWIPFSDDMLDSNDTPAHKQEVWVTDSYGNVLQATYFKAKIPEPIQWAGEGFYQIRSGYGYCDIDAIAWTVLKPYKK